MASLQKLIGLPGRVRPMVMMRVTPSRSSHADLRNNAVFFRRALRNDRPTLLLFLTFLSIASTSSYMVCTYKFPVAIISFLPNTLDLGYKDSPLEWNWSTWYWTNLQALEHVHLPETIYFIVLLVRASFHFSAVSSYCQCIGMITV